MASTTNIVLQDAATTPAQHTFSPMSVIGGTDVNYRNLASGTGEGLQETLRITKKTGKALRVVESSIVVPRVVTETVNSVSVSKVVDFMTMKFTVLVPQTWSEADVKKALGLQASLPLDVTFLNMATRGEGVW